MKKYLIRSRSGLSGLAATLALLLLTGCVGYVGPGPGYVDVGGPEVVFGDYGWHHDREASRRGYESRGGGHDRDGGWHH